MRKIPLLIIFILLNHFSFSQTKLSNELSTLFFDLNLEGSVSDIISNANLKFEPFHINDTITGEIEKNFIANFDKHKLIGSKIIFGECTINQKSNDIKKEKFIINQKITFKTLEEVIHEYQKLSSEYEKFGVRILESTVEGDAENSGYQNKVISIETESKLITLTFMYPIPIKDKTEYNFYIICKFRKLWYKQ